MAKQTKVKMKHMYFRNSKILVILVFALVSNVAALAQERLVRGKVTAATGETGIPGVTVVVKGTQSGSITNAGGEYEINAASGQVLIFSFLGYKSKEVTLGSETSLNVVLEDDVTMLNEVVAVGYGSQSRQTVTTSVAKLDTKVLKNVALSNAASSLQGTIPGLRVVNTSGQPGSAPTILLRGGASINSPGSPLVVVDGIVRTFNDVNPSDIESVEVLKDAASTAIYGARANNGVILVTTKKGKAGFSEIQYKVRTGINYLRTAYDYVDARDYLYYNRLGVRRTNTARSQGGVAPLVPDNQTGFGTNLPNIYSTLKIGNANRGQFQSLQGQGYGWLIDPFNDADTLMYKDYGNELRNAAFKNPAMTQDHYLSFTGGNEKAKFASSIGYYKEDGLVVGTKYERFSGSLSGSYLIKPNFEVSSSVAFTLSKLPPIYQEPATIFYRVQSLWPTFKPFDDNGNPNPNNGVANGNPLYYLNQYVRKNEARKTTLNVGARWEIIKDLELRAQVNAYYTDDLNESFNKSIQYQTTTVPDVTRAASASYLRQLQQQHNLTLGYVKNVGGHNISMLVGGEYFDVSNFAFSAAGTKAATDFIYTLNAVTERTATSTSWVQQRILSTFGRLNYDFNGKYLLSAVMRYDGISRLAKGSRWAAFPGVSVGWNMHREAFFGDLGLDQFITTFKPRGSYGVNGNVAGVGEYEVQGGYGIQTLYGAQAGFLNTAMVNTNLKWERSASINLGADIGILKNRATISFDYFNRTTSDLLTNLSLPGYTGFSSIRTNLGSLRNRGFELDINANVLRLDNGLTWDLGVNTSYVRNRILKLPVNGNERNRQGGYEVYDPAQGKNVWVGGIQEGGMLGDMFGYKQERILRDWDDVNQSVADRYDAIAELYGPKAYADLPNKTGKYPIEPGDVLWADLDNNGIINTLDRVKVGNMFPKWTGGMTSTLTYKNLSLSARFDYALGHTIYNDVYARILGQMQGTFNVITDVKKMWSEENMDTDLPKFYYADQASKKNITRSNNAGTAVDNNSSRFYEKGDYLALRELTLAYNLPKAWTSKVKMSNVRVNITGQNLSYFTGYTGTSPEPGVVGNSPQMAGLDAGRYPLPRTLLFGLEVSF
jgi:TonB-linked SusC/RagA family outer membrane protein